ncbi:heme lyase CcmF/NrfE family subunit [Vibrio sinensis]|uniref:Heme lyase CcmF/NrfE family subunit n=1 Tax=Vibrio sinensis TaxID=2302434 RepID=A0A3A6QMC5_9VIBR|nr:heme lyase CcmF/NrfE family subunit [Vibrio sinensis]RJX67507.1 heme lyase CcmF/NrfE family subunit [Vibrio sinensis]
MGELGLLALIFVAMLSSTSSVVYVLRRARNQQPLFSLVQISHLNAFFSLLSLIVLAILFLTNQFTFAYVASHSNIALPTPFKLAAVWGGHQGSMLFWVMTLCCWSALIAVHKQRNSRYFQDVLWIMQLLIAAFSWFTLLGSNPFEYNAEFVVQGRDLNPMLQDIGLIFHPPLLYLGYIGFSTVLAFAFAALMQPHYDHRWVLLSQYWAVSAWVLLTIGIGIGSWWAYNELGWGGWWFWDPVENASLLPWLTGTALLHAMYAARTRKMLQLWALILALVTFSLSILGTFIVRSGVLTSVHAFAVDPGKGLALLGILSVVLIGSFGLLIMRSDQVVSERIESILSRSYFTLFAIGLLSVGCFTVFLGTFYPMVYELLGLGAISVGAPYFNTLFVPLSLITLIVMGLAPFLQWQRGIRGSWKTIVVLFTVSFLMGVAVYIPQVTSAKFIVAIAWGFGVWVMTSHLFMLGRGKKLSFMLFAHIGIAVGVIGALMNAQHSTQISIKLGPGIEVEWQGWTVDYVNTNWLIGNNYTAEQAVIRFNDQNGNTFEVYPERRYYPVRVMNMTEPAIRSFWYGDVYVTLGNRISDDFYAVKLQYNAYIFWIWGCGLLMIFGGIVSGVRALTRRYSLNKRGREVVQTTAI